MPEPLEYPVSAPGMDDLLEKLKQGKTLADEFDLAWSKLSKAQQAALGKVKKALTEEDILFRQEEKQLKLVNQAYNAGLSPLERLIDKRKSLLAVTKELQESEKGRSALQKINLKIEEAEARVAANKGRTLSMLFDELKGSLTKLDGPLAGVQKGLGAVTGASEAGMASIGLMVGVTATLAAGAAVAGGALVGMGLHAYEAIDSIADLADRSSISATELSKFRAASEHLDVPLSTITDSIKKFDLAMFAAQTTTTEQARLFRAIGVDVKDAEGKQRSFSATLPELAAKFGQLGSAEEQVVLATKLFGKSGDEMLPIMRLGADGVQKMIDKNAALGLELSGPSLEAAGNYETASKDLKLELSSMAEAIGVLVLPTMTKMAEYAGDAATGLRDMILPIKDITSEADKAAAKLILMSAATEHYAAKTKAAAASPLSLAAAIAAQEEAVEKAALAHAASLAAQLQQDKEAAASAKAAETAEKNREKSARDAAQARLDAATAISKANEASRKEMALLLAQQYEYETAVNQVAQAEIAAGIAAEIAAGKMVGSWVEANAVIKASSSGIFNSMAAESEAAGAKAASAWSGSFDSIGRSADKLSELMIKSSKKQGDAAEKAAVLTFKLGQAASAVGIVMSTSQAVMAALVTPGPAGYAMAIAAGLAGAAQLAFVLSQSPPSSAGPSTAAPPVPSAPSATGQMTTKGAATGAAIAERTGVVTSTSDLGATTGKTTLAEPVVTVTDAHITGSAQGRLVRVAPGDAVDAYRDGALGRSARPSSDPRAIAAMEANTREVAGMRRDLQDVARMLFQRSHFTAASGPAGAY